MAAEKSPWRFVRLGLAVAALVAFMYLVWSAYDHEAVMAWLHGLRPVPYFAAMAVLPAIGVPTTPLYILAGASFGIWIGVVGSLIALAANLALCFWVARGLRPTFRTLLRKFHAELPDFSEREKGNFRFVLGVRVAPGVPAVLKNYALGMSGVSFTIYMVVAMLFAGVYGVAFVVVGEALLDHQLSRTAIAIAAVAVLAVAVMVYRRRKRGRH
ncbi:MAG TPA: VTT domain-containing protein [Kofleriaceae bacterium]|nr:VTT domain-containing protein [Kofleriaceae bacterium]